MLRERVRKEDPQLGTGNEATRNWRPQADDQKGSGEAFQQVQDRRG